MLLVVTEAGNTNSNTKYKQDVVVNVQCGVKMSFKADIYNTGAEIPT